MRGIRVVDPKARAIADRRTSELEACRRWSASSSPKELSPPQTSRVTKSVNEGEKNHRKDTALLRKTSGESQAKNDALTKRCDVLRTRRAALRPLKARRPLAYDDVHIASGFQTMTRAPQEKRRTTTPETEQEWKLAALLLEEESWCWRWSETIGPSGSTTRSRLASCS